jgi:acetyl esterase/lipase
VNERRFMATGEVLVCTPVGTPASRPVLYFMHGGGFFCNDHRIGLGQQLDTAERLGATLISVGYRLAPEHPCPAQINDAYAGLLWVADHADELGVDPERIVVTGYSAGGGLSAALALTVRDKGGPRLLGQLLMASAECLRDEVLAYADRIWQAGGRAELHVWPGAIHAFDRDDPDTRISKAAIAARRNWLERLLAAS